MAKKVFFVESYKDVKAHECVIIRRGESDPMSYIAQKYVGDVQEDLMEFDGIDLEDEKLFKESIVKLRKVVGEDVRIYCERIEWIRPLSPEEIAAEESCYEPSVEEKILDEMAKKRGEL